MIELKPCPFCGGEAISYKIEPHSHTLVDMPDYAGSGFAECTACGCCLSDDNEEKAVEKWNRRVTE